MTPSLPPALKSLIDLATAREPLGTGRPPESWTADALGDGRAMYVNRNDKLNIDFSVDRLEFPDIQTMDPRVVRIAPGKNNELHKHAHESIFVVLAGSGEVRIGDVRRPIGAGGIAFVPRWIFHQTRNTSATEELVLLAITDFGFTSALLGDYDRRTRLAAAGDDVTAGSAEPAGER